MNNLIEIINEKDLEKLEFHLSSGWTPPKINARYSGRVVDYTFLTETVLKDWGDGLKLFYDYYPNIITKKAVWDIALNNASINCIKFLWDKFNFNVEKINKDPDQKIKNSWLISLMKSMGGLSSNNFESKNIIPVIVFLYEKDIVLNGFVSGKYEVGDLKIEGHSLFTRAIDTENWKLVDVLWDKIDISTFAKHKKNISKDWLVWPRLNEVIFHLMDIIVGDYKHFTPDSHSDDDNEEELDFFNGINEISNHSDSSKKPLLNSNNCYLNEKNIFIHWLKEFGVNWFNSPFDINFLPKEFQNFEPPSLIHALSLSKSVEVSSWLRLSLFLSYDEKKIVYGLWNKILKIDKQNVWLNTLSMHPEDPVVKEILLDINKYSPEIIQNYWDKKDEKGFSPKIKWENLDGEKLF